MKKEEQHFNTIAKYLSENSNPKEREDLFAWVKERPENKALLEDSMEVWEASEPSALEFQPDVAAAWEKMDKRIVVARKQNVEEAKIRPLRFWRPWLRIAAAAVILLGIAFWFLTAPKTVTEQTIAQEKTMIELPDGSKVWLNQNSTLKYQKEFHKRIVFLEGEAFFEVAKMPQKPFEIYAGQSKTRVLGTSFNVRAYPKENNVEIAVESGKVEFSAEENPTEKALLVKDEFAIYTKSNQKVQKLDIAKLNAAAWQKGALRFDNSKMGEVIEALERYYEIEIEVENNNIYNCVWNNTGTYKQPSLDTLISQIDFVLGTALKIEPQGEKGYRFSGTGCD